MLLHDPKNVINMVIGANSTAECSDLAGKRPLVYKSNPALLSVPDSGSQGNVFGSFLAAKFVHVAA